MTGLSPMSRFGLTKLPRLVTVFGLLAVWQALYWAVGEIALRSPWETLQFTRRFVASDSFFGHLHESLRAFGAALVLSIVLGLAIGFTLGLSRF